MQHQILTLTIAAALNIGASLSSQARQPVHEHLGETATTTIPAQPFATDAALREGMARIHLSLDELKHYEMGHMPLAMAIERADTIQNAIDFLFANCKLDAQADAALHGMIVPLLAALQTFREDPNDMSSIAAMREAIADYVRLFADPE